MAEAKSTTLTVHVKQGLRAMAEQERRSLTNMIEVMIRDYCKRSGVAIKKPDLVC